MKHVIGFAARLYKWSLGNLPSHLITVVKSQDILLWPSDVWLHWGNNDEEAWSVLIAG